MKLSEAIREYVELKIEGEPKGSEWSSIDSNARRRNDYRERLEELEQTIDAAIQASEKAPAGTAGGGGSGV